VKIDIIEIKAPDLDAQLVAENIAMQMERRISFRRAMKKALQTTMEQVPRASRSLRRPSWRRGNQPSEWYREEASRCTRSARRLITACRSSHDLRNHRGEVLDLQTRRCRAGREEAVTPSETPGPPSSSPLLTLVFF